MGSDEEGDGTMSGFDVAAVIAIFSALIASHQYVTRRLETLTERMKNTEDCVETEIKGFKDALNAFKLEVTNRLTAIEVAIKSNREK
jgi:hypothetical protein